MVLGGGDDDRNPPADGASATATPTATPSDTTGSPTIAATETATPGSTRDASASPGTTPSGPPAATATPATAGTSTSAATATRTSVPPTNSATATATRTPTLASTATRTLTPTATRTPTPTATPTKTQVHYGLSAYFTDDLYILPYDEYAVLCYQLSPQNVPFTIDFYKVNDAGTTYLGSFNDNGIGGGDCIDVPLDYDDAFGMYVYMEAYVDGALVADATAEASIAIS